MPRIAPLPRSKYSLGARILDRVTLRMFGQRLEQTGIVAHSPGLVWTQSWMDKYVSGKRSVPNRLLELVCLRTAMELGCSFCIDLGSHASTLPGVTPEELHALADYVDSSLFDTAEKAALDLAVAMASTPVAVDDALIARLAQHYDERQIVELTATAAWENHRSRFNVSMGLDAQGFSEASACAVPAGAAALGAVASAGA